MLISVDVFFFGTVTKFNDAGVAFEPFNMKNEREGAGFIDENLNFVFSKDKADVDAWVADMSGADSGSLEQAIGEAAFAKKKRDAERAIRDEREAEELQQRKSSLDLKIELLTLMRPGETIPRAMVRLKNAGGES